MADILYDLGVNIIADIIGFLVALLLTYRFVGFFLEKRTQKQELTKVKPIAKKAISYRLWWMLRFIALDVTRLSSTPTDVLENEGFFFDHVHEEPLAAMFDQIERLLEIYGKRIPDDVQNDLMSLGYMAGDLSESISRIKVNFSVKEHLEDWKHLREDAQQLTCHATELVKRLEKEGLLEKELAERYALVMAESSKYQDKWFDFLTKRYPSKRMEASKRRPKSSKRNRR